MTVGGILKKTLLLIDGSNFIFRAYHAVPPLTTSDGRPTNAIRGFLSMLRVLMKDVPTEYVACVVDPKGKTFRSDIYPEYKANRPPMPEELAVQIPVIFEGVKKEGIPFLQVPGIEADDTIGTLAKRATAEGFTVVIATGDKDYAQLVNEDVILINTMGKDNTWMNTEGVIQKFGVPPDRIIDYLALMGDKIDNVPGVPKCGEKTAVKWINEYGSMDGVIENADKIKGKIGENLRNSLEFLPTARALVTIKTDADLSEEVPTFETLRLREPNREELMDYYNKLEFRTWARELKKSSAAGEVKSLDSASSASKRAVVGAAPIEGETLDLFASESQAAPERKLTIIQDETQAKELAQHLEKLAGQEEISMYVISEGEGQQSLQPLGAAFGRENGESWYVPIEDGILMSDAIAPEVFGDIFKNVLNNPKLGKAGYDIKQTRHVFANVGLTLEGMQDDVMLQSYVLEAHRSHAIEKLAMNWLQYELADEESLLGKGAKKKSFRDVGTEKTAEFASQRAYVIARLNRLFNKALSDDKKLESIYRDIELPISLVLFKMEQNGVLIDSMLLNKQTAELQAQLKELEEKAYEAAGETFKLSSPKQLGEILFDKMGVMIADSKPKKTASGNYSTSEEVLSELAADYPLAKIALEYRTLSKLMTTYTEKLPHMVDKKDGRIHTTFEQAVAVTGRLSSTNPNLQNIPIRTEEGRKVREAFIAAPGCKLISADYSQIELRIMAHLSEDPGLVDAFRHNADIHTATAAEVFGKARDQVTPNDRRIAKVINFGLIYGMSAFGLAKNLGIDRQDAKNYITKYFARYPGVRDYMDRIKALADRQGYVETALGRRLWLPDMRAGGMRRAAAERAAINAPMQGSAADLIKLSMIAVQKWIEDKKLKSKLILQIHDELIMEVPEDEVALVTENLPKIMDSVVTLHVPLIAEVGSGDNWEAAH